MPRLFLRSAPSHAPAGAKSGEHQCLLCFVDVCIWGETLGFPLTGSLSGGTEGYTIPVKEVGRVSLRFDFRNDPACCFGPGVSFAWVPRPRLYGWGFVLSLSANERAGLESKR